LPTCSSSPPCFCSWIKFWWWYYCTSLLG